MQKKKKVKRTMREKLPSNVVRNRIFKAFSQNETLSIDQIVEKTDQPKKWLRPYLSEFCEFIRRGENRNTWQLKPQFKKKNQPTQPNQPTNSDTK